MVSKVAPALDEEGQRMLKERDTAALATAYQACLRLQQLRKPDNLSNEVIDVIESLGYKISKILLIDEAAGQLKPFAIRKNAKTSRKSNQPAASTTTLPLGEGLVGSVARSGNAVRIGDVRRVKTEFEGSQGVRSLLCVPMHVGERVIGVVTAEEPKKNAFSEQDEKILGVLADSIGVAIENANIFSQVRRYAAEQEQRVAARTSELESVIAQLDETKVERKITVEALRLSDERYKALVERLPLVIYTTERISSRRTLYVGPEIERKLGYSPVEWTSKTVLWFASLHPDDRDRVLNEIAEAKTSGADSLSLEYRLVGRDGSTFWFRDEAGIIRDEGGRRFALEGLMLDITDQKLEVQARLNRIEKLIKENNNLRDLNEGLSAFSHMVAHDLKNPLAILLGFAEVLKQDYVGGKDELLSQAITAIVQNAQRM
ncbi:MAG: PAS domain-containing protein [Candidatus Promineifilaceae bacterium]